MLAKATKFLLVMTLAASIGLHWALLQSVAWTSMLAANLRRETVTQAVERTFDGQHPCPLCKAIAKGKSAERKNAASLELKKFECPAPEESIALSAPPAFQWLTAPNIFARSFSTSPITPPPRGRLS